MAYLRRITIPRCAVDGCQRVSTDELFNARNARISAYCSPHAQAALAKLSTEEAGRPFDSLPKQ